MIATSIVLALLAQAAPAAPAKAELAGVVVDSQGHPVAGVEVLLSSCPWVGREVPALGAHDDRRAGAVPTRVAPLGQQG